MSIKHFFPAQAIASLPSLLVALALLPACGGGGGSASPVSTSPAPTQDTAADPNVADGEAVATSPLDPWIINTTARSKHIFESGSTIGVLEDVQLAELRTVDGAGYVYVEATGIPNYDVEITQDAVDSLNNRPLATRDFGIASTLATVGQVVSFGQDIGYVNGGSNCARTGGEGYWPPGPDCPTDQAKAEFVPAEPAPGTDSCATGLGAIGVMVNGASIFNWGDGMSYGDNVWYTLAPVAEQYDVDICGGHAANGDYHHHFYTSCLAARVGDEGGAHSPIYGFIADGYPLYGPWESSGTLAVSGWAPRDYGASSAAGGCGTPGERTCILINPLDASQGVDSAISQGPDIGSQVSTLSGNTLNADAGYYMEDYYYLAGPVAGARLDEHNGHDTGDGLGYHYHITLVNDGSGHLSPSFPYTAGPSFYGSLPDNALSACGGVAQGGGGPPPGPPPG